MLHFPSFRPVYFHLRSLSGRDAALSKAFDTLGSRISSNLAVNLIPRCTFFSILKRAKKLANSANCSRSLVDIMGECLQIQ